MDYTTDIVLGERYRDKQTGIEGVAVAVHFFQFACERVSIETVVNGKIEDYAFDAPRLTSVETGEQAQSERPGGPGDNFQTDSIRPHIPRRSMR